MADYNSSYTGAQIDNAVGKASKLPVVSSADEGKVLQVDSNGNIIPVSSGGGSSVGGFNCSLSIAMGSVTLHFADGTTQTGATSGTYQNVVYIDNQIAMPQLEDNFGILLKVTNGVELIDYDSFGGTLGETLVLLTDVNIRGLGNG